MQIAFLSTRWGPQKGGINALNAAFCHAIHEALNEPILCIVEEATAAERRDAVEQGVFLIVIERSIDSSEACIETIEQHLVANGATVNFWVGHDVWTGPTAIVLGRRSGARSIVVHHMDFEAYAHLKHSDLEADKRSRRQGDVLRSADVVFGVGPTLTDSATKAQARVVHQLSPGLPQIDHSAVSVGEYEILMIGRLSREDDPIKQVQLAVAAVAKASNARGLGREPWRMRLIGFDPVETDLDYATKLRTISEGGRRHPNLRLLPFEKIQADLFEKLARADLVLMPSMREGFGLVGWEAIAAGVPLILGTASGLFRHLTDLGFAPMVRGIDVRGGNASAGEHDSEDVDALADLIENAFRERKASKQTALVLRGALLGHAEAQWRTAADRFLQQVGFARKTRVREVALPRASNLEALSALLAFSEWDGESLHQLLEEWDPNDLDDSERVTGILQATVQPSASIQHLGALHYALVRFGHSPKRDDFFSRAKRGILPPSALDIDLVAIPEGEFTPGSPLDEPKRWRDEGPGQPVQVSAFRFSRTTITNRQFCYLQPDRKFYRWPDMSEHDAANHPVVSVNWWEAYLFSIWAGGRLPTEIEWEYACRAGTISAYYCGATMGPPTINALARKEQRSSALNRTLPADGMTVPHLFDLRHMHGNVWEWCWNDYHPDYYPEPRPKRDACVEKPVNKVARGGSWDVPADACRSAFRNRHRPNYHNNDMGFRLLVPS